MKRFFSLFILLSLCFHVYGRFTAQCDVIYEKSVGEWSEFHRVNVEFVSGREMRDIMNQNSVYAVIWYSQTECSVIKMDYNTIITSDIDKFFVFMLFGSDMLNEGLPGVQTNDNGEHIKWRIYGKDENSFMIDPVFNDFTYNEGVQRNIKNGSIVKRQRPKEETQYSGLVKGTVEFVSPKEWYIVKTKNYYVGVRRNPIYYFGGSIDVGDIVFADFYTKGQTSISNSTKQTTHHHVIVEYLCSTYQECYNLMKQKYE